MSSTSTTTSLGNPVVQNLRESKRDNCNKSSFFLSFFKHKFKLKYESGKFALGSPRLALGSGFIGGHFLFVEKQVGRKKMRNLFLKDEIYHVGKSNEWWSSLFVFLLLFRR